MMRLAIRLLLVALLASPCPAFLPAQTPTGPLVLTGQGGATKTLSLAELQALPQVDVVIRVKDSSTVTFRGPTVRSLMTLVDAPAGDALRGPSLLLAVLAEAADGYRVAYMLAELDERFGARQSHRRAHPGRSAAPSQ